MDGGDFVAHGRQIIPNQPAELFVVINDKHPRAYHTGSRRGGLCGGIECIHACDLSFRKALFIRCSRPAPRLTAFRLESCYFYTALTIFMRTAHKCLTGGWFITAMKTNHQTSKIPSHVLILTRVRRPLRLAWTFLTLSIATLRADP